MTRVDQAIEKLVGRARRTEKMRKTTTDAARLVVDRYNRMVAAGQGREFYGSVERAIQAAADQLVAEKLLDAGAVKDAAEAAVKFVVPVPARTRSR